MSRRLCGHEQQANYPSRIVAVILAALLGAITGCAGSGEDTSGTGGSTGRDCGPGQVTRVGGGCCEAGELPLHDGRCLPAGEQENGCRAGEAPVDEGTARGGACRPAGIPPELCGQGFEPDGDGACDPILPVAPCPSGTMAVPGETQCHEVAPCGAGKWGDIPVEASTQFVDSAYGGENGPSDGSAARPWTAIQDGIDAADSGAIVAVTDGFYLGDLEVTTPVRLWGKCPAQVEIGGNAAGAAAVTVNATADGAEIHDLAILGPGAGIALSGPRNLGVSRVWIHDTGWRGIDLEDSSSVVGLTVRGSLIERAHRNGVYVVSAAVTIEGTVIRETRPDPADQTGGRGMSVLDGGSAGQRAKAVISGSVLVGNHEVGLAVFGSDALLLASWVSQTEPQASDQQGGIGIAAFDDIATGERADVTVRASVVAGNRAQGIFIYGSDAVIESTVVRLTQPRASDNLFGRGIDIEDEAENGSRSSVKVLTSVVENNRNAGVFVMGSDAVIEGSVVRRTEPDASDNKRGWGIDVKDAVDTGAGAVVVISRTVVEGNHAVGVSVTGANATLDATVVRATQPQTADSDFGRGIEIEDRPDPGVRSDVLIRGCVVEDNHEIGLLIAGSTVAVETTIVRGTLPRALGQLFGRGIAIQDNAMSGRRAEVTINATVVEKNHDAGVVLAGSSLHATASAFRNTEPSAVDQSHGIGIFAEVHPDTGGSAELSLDRCVVEGNLSAGVVVHGSKALIDTTVVRDTAPQASDSQYGRAIGVEREPGTSLQSDVVVRDCLLEGSHDTGVYIEQSTVKMEGTTIRHTEPQVSDGLFGDAIAIFADSEGGAALTVANCHILDSARAGISSFGASVSVSATTLECNAVALDGEALGILEFSIEDGGGNVCSCNGDTSACQVKTLGFAAPHPIDPL